MSALILLACFGSLAKGERLESSILWQPADKMVYFSGIPAVVRFDQLSDKPCFRIEQYYDSLPEASSLNLEVRGSWPHSAGAIFYETTGFECSQAEETTSARQAYRNDFFEYLIPSCVEDQERYRCTIDFRLLSAVPAGTVRVEVRQWVEGENYLHPNSVFWVVVPLSGEDDPRLSHSDTVDAWGGHISRWGATKEGSAEESTQGYSPCFSGFVASEERSSELKVSDYVVRVRGSGNVMLGSGFISREAERLKGLTSNFRADIDELIDGDLYLVTAVETLASVNCT